MEPSLFSLQNIADLAGYKPLDCSWKYRLAECILARKFAKMAETEACVCWEMLPVFFQLKQDGLDKQPRKALEGHEEHKKEGEINVR